ncbi:MAG: arginyl-tRNA synthetase [Planctomycetota bacterium]|jgi:arginyl-tRNA synthetase
MNINTIIKVNTQKAMKVLFDVEIETNAVSINETRKEFDGEATVVTFPFVRFTKKSPEETGNLIGEYLVANVEEITAFNTVKGFLNLCISDKYWINFFKSADQNNSFGTLESTGKKIVLEYCGPNTNKPLHLGHIRNMLLGFSTANLLTAAGNQVHKVNIYNDRGSNISKSMVAWQKYAHGETPQSTSMKGDHFVGKYYVRYNTELNKEVAELVAKGVDKKEAEKIAPIVQAVNEMTILWEAHNPEVLALWNKMNGWVYEGFETSFNSLGIDFEKHYKESDYYIKGRDLVLQGVDQGIFEKKEDGAVFVDLTDDGLDEKILIRSNGTSVYITQDMGIAEARYNDYKFDQMIYVVGQEQDYHFDVLKKVIHKLGNDYSDSIMHFSYGMVSLPEGKMKSREGTVVDADDLIQSMIDTATQHSKELGKVDDLPAEEVTILNRKIALAALKFFILKVNPKKGVMFNPKESIDFQGNTGPFIQYTYTRINSMITKNDFDVTNVSNDFKLEKVEKDLILELHKLPSVISSASKNYDVSELASYIYNLAKAYNKFYANVSVIKAETTELKNFRLSLSSFVAKTLKANLLILGIEVPERM